MMQFKNEYTAGGIRTRTYGHYILLFQHIYGAQIIIGGQVR